jgi:hypothetical protein
MSLQPPPDVPQPPGTDGLRPPPPDWAPAPLAAAGQASYASRPTDDPHKAGPAHPGASIGRFAPKRTLVPLLVALAGVLIGALVIYSASQPGTATSESTPTPTPAASGAATPRDGTPFTVTNTGTTGVWKIADKRWTDKGLDVLVEVRVDNGVLNCYFNALPNSGQEVVRSEASDLTPAFPDTAIRPGSTTTGWVFLPIERGTTLVFLRTADQPQVSGIEVAG